MTEIFFYHLEQAPLEKVLPALLEKTLEREWKAVVEVGAPDKLKEIDDSLWTFRQESFLPHGLAGDERDAEQPVLITAAADNPNAADVRFFVQRALPRAGGVYQRLVFLFDGHDPDAVSAARQAWKSLSADHDTTYWQQESNGKWIKKA